MLITKFGAMITLSLNESSLRLQVARAELTERIQNVSVVAVVAVPAAPGPAPAPAVPG